MTGIRIVKAARAKVQEMDWGRLTWLASKELGNSETMTTGLCEIRPGCANPRHSHPNCEEVLHVLRGRISHTVGDEEVEMSAGDTIAVTADVPHNARNTGDEDAVLFICFSAPERKTVGE